MIVALPMLASVTNLKWEQSAMSRLKRVSRAIYLVELKVAFLSMTAAVNLHWEQCVIKRSKYVSHVN